MENRKTYAQVLHLPARSIRPGRPPAPDSLRPCLTDLHVTRPGDPAATGFVLSLLAPGEGPVLWVQDHGSRRDCGRLHMPGLRTFGIDRAVLQVRVNHPRDVLWAMEEGAGCAGLSAVVGELQGTPAALDFTATKRLAIRAEASGVPVYLIRNGDPGGLSAARARWRIASLPSQAHPHDPLAPGAPRWDADLFKVRGHAPGHWVARYDSDAPRIADRLDLASRSDAGTLDRDDPAIPDAAGG
ncbi:hypothetical protein AB1M95_08080 [Sulfitobacter sp. LCG007]